jgi:hypothetical protein
LAGVPVVYVNPRYTSQTCSRCGHGDKRNRPTRDDFKCVQCGTLPRLTTTLRRTSAGLPSTSRTRARPASSRLQALAKAVSS